MKMNKKGFTLIEMLVVIAIIAVLVAIIIPTVSSSTVKAKAAADAANLRSVIAEASLDYLGNVEEDTGYVKFTPKSGNTAASFTARANAPACESVANATLTITVDANGNVTATYGNYTVNDFATAAETGTLATK